MEMVLIADHDLGFVFWLGAALSEAGYFVLPAPSVRRAKRFARQIDFSLVIANPSLLGIADFVESLRREQPPLKLIAAIEDLGAGTGNLIGVDGILSKAEPANETTRQRWVDQVATLTGNATLAHSGTNGRPAPLSRQFSA
jgi:hypothetical protein